MNEKLKNRLALIMELEDWREMGKREGILKVSKNVITARMISDLPKHDVSSAGNFWFIKTSFIEPTPEQIAKAKEAKEHADLSQNIALKLRELTSKELRGILIDLNAYVGKRGLTQ